MGQLEEEEARSSIVGGVAKCLRVSDSQIQLKDLRHLEDWETESCLSESSICLQHARVCRMLWSELPHGCPLLWGKATWMRCREHMYSLISHFQNFFECLPCVMYCARHRDLVAKKTGERPVI